MDSNFDQPYNFEEYNVNLILESLERSLVLFEQAKEASLVPPELSPPLGYNGYFLKRTYSTDPNKMTLSTDDLHGECYEESDMLSRILFYYDGLIANIVESSHHSPLGPYLFHHFYLNVVLDHHKKIIIDPTIGQFLTSYKGVYVGTASNLRKLFVTTMLNNPAVFSKRWEWVKQLLHHNPEEMFEVIWGSDSIKA